MAATLLLGNGCGNQEKQTQNDMNNEVIETIMARRSIRAYQPQAVEREIMDQIVNAASTLQMG